MLQCDLAISLLGIYLKEMKTYVHAKMCIQISYSIIHNSKKKSGIELEQWQWKWTDVERETF